jgi:hypothetical protein
MQAKSDAIAKRALCAIAMQGGSFKGASPQAGEKRHRINRCNQAIAVLIALSICGSK